MLDTLKEGLASRKIQVEKKSNQSEKIRKIETSQVTEKANVTHDMENKISLDNDKV